MIFKFVYKKTDIGTVYMRVWAGLNKGQLALAGKLTMRKDEFQTFKSSLEDYDGGDIDPTVYVFEEQQVTSKDSPLRSLRL